MSKVPWSSLARCCSCCLVMEDDRPSNGVMVGIRLSIVKRYISRVALDWRYQANALIDSIPAVGSAIRKFGPTRSEIYSLPVTRNSILKKIRNAESISRRTHTPNFQMWKICQAPGLQTKVTAQQNKSLPNQNR